MCNPSDGDEIPSPQDHGRPSPRGRAYACLDRFPRTEFRPCTRPDSNSCMYRIMDEFRQRQQNVILNALHDSVFSLITTKKTSGSERCTSRKLQRPNERVFGYRKYDTTHYGTKHTTRLAAPFVYKPFHKHVPRVRTGASPQLWGKLDA